MITAAPCCFAWLLFPLAWSVQGSDLGCQPKGGHQNSFECSSLLSSPNQTPHRHTHTRAQSLGQTSSVCSSLKCEVCDFHAVFNSFSQVMAAVLIISTFLYKVFRSHFRIRVEQGHLTLTLTGNAGKVSIKSAAKPFGNSEGKCANWCANCIQNISNFI